MENFIRSSKLNDILNFFISVIQNIPDFLWNSRLCSFYNDFKTFCLSTSERQKSAFSPFGWNSMPLFHDHAWAAKVLPEMANCAILHRREIVRNFNRKIITLFRFYISFKTTFSNVKIAFSKVFIGRTFSNFSGRNIKNFIFESRL